MLYGQIYGETSLFGDAFGSLEGGESGDSRWVGEEGEGLCLQMLLVWMLNLHRNVLQMTAGVNKVAFLRDR